MNDLFLYSQIDSNLLLVESPLSLREFHICDQSGQSMEAPVIRRRQLDDGKYQFTLDAAALQCWSPETPVLYTLKADHLEPVTFGHSELKTLGNSQVLVNGNPYYLRGYIRGIIAHDHPNLTGGNTLDACRKNIRQAKKFGFNLVRFHSTVPSPEFVRAADELGIFIHMEIGFSYEYGPDGKPAGLALDNRNWRETILRYRNHPSLMIFCIGNEMHQSGHQPQVKRLYQEGKALAPNKLIMDNSGWGEFDRDTADIYSQHIAYYFPFKHHREMFRQDDCWHINGSVHDSPLKVETDGVTIRRHANPLRPVLAHEAVHYIDIPDYDALAAKFDRFCEQVGPDYLKANGIEKPRFMTELPELIRRKGLAERFPDYIAASQKFKKIAIKTYLEQLRLSTLCGFEMLQFADCFKYENKNGIVDCFDDDGFISADWLRQVNDASVLLADWPEECFFAGQTVRTKLYLSHFALPANTCGTLRLLLNGEEIYRGEHLTTVPGVQKLLDLDLTPETGRHELAAEFTSPELNLTNQWLFWVYPQVTVPAPQEGVIVLDRLTDEVFEHLAAGKTVLLHYHRDTPGHQYYWPGALDRFKPCIWDRGSNLGGIIRPAWAEQALLEHYFDVNLQPLVEGAYKVNLDDFPAPVDELISGVDKPVRDRMKGLVQGVKHFIDADTLRNFCYLLAIRVGAGKLVISTFNRSDRPGAANYHAALLRELPEIDPKSSITPEALKDYLSAATARGPVPEDVMNHFWEIDNKPVEDTLFWEESGLDLAKIQ